ncbi:IclR family transcriptional regulator [Herbaspirillum rhizosphaerae]|uniref:IclR family transcriptional regulator n=1 Tax=Herbaspirillum rhizosphaerae TaxID=346179 RepID=UPI00067E59DB|nr:IclR family transcriptional regulator C-terminal domain-containing protein [Herbaspirillum rhizosphaerae]
MMRKTTDSAGAKAPSTTSKTAKAVKTEATTTAAEPARPDNTGVDSPLYVNSVEKSMRVLMAFDGQQRQLSLSQIAALTGFDLSTAQRFTYTLMTLGYLTKDEEVRKYELAPKVLNFAYHYLTSSELVRRATPYLQQLSQETEETTNLTILDGPDVVFVQRIVSRNVLNPNVVTGTRLPAYCTASGLAIMSTLSEAEVDDILDHTDLKMYTPFTIADRDKIKQRLAKFREQGYAHIREEYFFGDISTAAVITDSRIGRAVGAVNLAITTARWSGDADERRHADLVMSAARVISIQGR